MNVATFLIVIIIQKHQAQSIKIIETLTSIIQHIQVLTKKTKYLLYIGAVCMLLYCSESWTLCAQQERKLNMFHMCCLQCMFGITWQDKVHCRVVLE